MFYDHRARSVHKRLQLPVFSRASSFVEILISRERIFHATLPPPPSLSRHSPFLSLPPFFRLSLGRRQLAASSSFVVEPRTPLRSGSGFIVTFSPVHPSIIIIVSPRYRFGTINKSAFVAQCGETMAATD